MRGTDAKHDHEQAADSIDAFMMPSDFSHYCVLRFWGLAGALTSAPDVVVADATFDSGPNTAPALNVPLYGTNWNW